MIKNKSAFLISLFISTLMIGSSVLAREDIGGSSDHPEIPRITGSTIVAYFNSEFAEHEFLLDYDKKGKTKSGENAEIVTKEGKLTRLVYVLEKDQTPIYALRNYQEAFLELGAVKELYTCRKKECWNHLGKNIIWSKEKRIDTSIKALDHMYKVSSYHKGALYWVAEVQSDKASYTVSVFSATINRFRNKNEKEGLDIGQAMVHIDIIEKASFKSDLSIVEASEIQQSIADKGHVALYGLYFDTGDDKLTEASEPALIEVSKALKEEQGLNLYVVGHTDSVGSFESNQKLSERRAASIVESLTEEFNIDSSRLVPIGVGLAAPVSTNNTEEGRSQNRRVELVERSN